MSPHTLKHLAGHPNQCLIYRWEGWEGVGGLKPSPCKASSLLGPSSLRQESQALEHLNQPQFVQNRCPSSPIHGPAAPGPMGSGTKLKESQRNKPEHQGQPEAGFVDPRAHGAGAGGTWGQGCGERMGRSQKRRGSQKEKLLEMKSMLFIW